MARTRSSAAMLTLIAPSSPGAAITAAITQRPERAHPAGLIRRSGSAYRVSGGRGRQLSRAPAARPFAGWRRSSPLLSAGAGTTGTGAVPGRTTRLTSPGAAGGRNEPTPGQGSPWLPYPVPAGGVQPRRYAAGQRRQRRHREAVASIAIRASLFG